VVRLRRLLSLLLCSLQIAACEEDIDRLHAGRATAEAEAEEADAAAQQALETGHAEVRMAAQTKWTTAKER
jgi:hypothetical protein